ncbi:hypothetical protein [Pyxidicoccus xibeiensis]|uniref:hypothetical protein n=1 Tax=Pyxidicoccus xibeiensis TaxID=2906759 RepID=UPI0020A82276|nr:hypothetical protein [Pyxidicoccus xibeiensis]MCP3139687.1 hypothetical protein [Pyxidicoccus xibeiensis]
MAWPESGSPFERRSIIQGMRVRAGDGTKLGYVAVVGEEHLYVRRWPFSRWWAEVPMSRVRHVGRGAVLLEGQDAGRRVPAGRPEAGELPTYTLPLTEPAGWKDGHR